MREIDTVVIHCSATRAKWMETAGIKAKTDEIRRWHVEEKKYDDVGYHWLIDRDGSIARGREPEIQGAHAGPQWNRRSLGICLIGGYGCSANDRFADHFTAPQNQELRRLIGEMKEIHGELNVIGHNDVANRECPGFDVARWLARKQPKPARNHASQSSTVRAAGFNLAGLAGVAAPALGFWDSMPDAGKIAVSAGAVIIAVSAVWILRERLIAWSRGRK